MLALSLVHALYFPVLADVLLSSRGVHASPIIRGRTYASVENVIPTVTPFATRTFVQRQAATTSASTTYDYTPIHPPVQASLKPQLSIVPVVTTTALSDRASATSSGGISGGATVAVVFVVLAVTILGIYIGYRYQSHRKFRLIRRDLEPEKPPIPQGPQTAVAPSVSSESMDTLVDKGTTQPDADKPAEGPEDTRPSSFMHPRPAPSPPTVPPRPEAQPDAPPPATPSVAASNRRSLSPSTVVQPQTRLVAPVTTEAQEVRARAAAMEAKRAYQDEDPSTSIGSSSQCGGEDGWVPQRRSALPIPPPPPPPPPLPRVPIAPHARRPSMRTNGLPAGPASLRRSVAPPSSFPIPMPSEPNTPETVQAELARALTMHSNAVRRLSALSSSSSLPDYGASEAAAREAALKGQVTALRAEVERLQTLQAQMTAEWQRQQNAGEPPPLYMRDP